MKKPLSFIVVFLIGSLLSYGQATPAFENEINELKAKLKSLQSDNLKLKTGIENLNKNLINVTLQLDSLKGKTDANKDDISSARRELGLAITETGNSSETKIKEVNKSLSKNTLYWIIAFLATALLSGLVYFLLGKRIKTGKTDVEEQISRTKKSLEEEGIKLDTKLTEVLETQLKLVQAERNNTNASANKSEEIDHTLAIRVADEIVRLNKNLSHMDANTRGLKQLSASVKRIEENFAANGYEMPDLLNKPFDARMKIIVVNSVPDENLKNGEELITKIIKPQVNYKGIMIQAAQVEVSVGQ
jgi:cell division protein FtsB